MKLRIIKNPKDHKVLPPLFNRELSKRNHSYHRSNRSNSISPYLCQRSYLLPQSRKFLSLSNMPRFKSFLTLKDVPSSLYFLLGSGLCLVNKLAFLTNDRWMFYILNWTSAFRRRQHSTEGTSITPGPASPL